MIYEGQAIQCRKIEDNIVELTFDRKDESVNKFDRVTLSELREAVDKLKAETSIDGLLVTSGKDAFIVGADITEFLDYFKQPEEELLKWLGFANQIFSDIEDLPYPSITAINGFALGGGFEMPLSTDYRIASTKAKVGLPEVKLGIYPGFGGTVRLSRLIGADNAIEWIATGNDNRAEDAFKNGAVDGVVAPDKLREASLKMLQGAIKGQFNWKQRREQKKAPLNLNDIERMMVFEGAKAFVAGKAGPHYPAPVEAIKAMQKGAEKGRDEALKDEAKGFVKVAKTDTTANLVNLFLGDQYLKKVAKDFTKQANPIKTGAVLGAGIMGGGIAYQSAYKGTPVVMKDINTAALQLGLNEASGLLQKRVDRGRMSAGDMAKTLNNIYATLSYGDLKEVDIVVEAVVEKEAIKKMVYKDLEDTVREDCIITSNTSTISITRLAEGLKRPENFCGMHFFNPVHRMPLVEVIRGEKSSDLAIATTVAYATKMGKTPVVVKDCPGFLVNRILFPYFAGFLGLLRDGADFKRVDKIMEKFGWPMGPAYLLDVVGIDTAHHAGEVMADGFPDRMKADFRTAIDVMYENTRYGQKNDKGFYVYPLDRKGRPKKTVDPEVEGLLKPIQTGSQEFTDEEIIERMMIPLIIESSRCLEDNIVNKPAEVDMGLIYGLGFPPFRGGALKYADTIGLAKLVEMSAKYESLGKIYEPTEQIKEMAKNGKTYY